MMATQRLDRGRQEPPVLRISVPRDGAYRDATTDALLACRGLGYRVRGRSVLEQVSFEVSAGEAYGVLGEAGAGKTTLARSVCGMLRPTSGAIWLAGRPVDELDRANLARSIGYMRHSVVTVASMTVAQTVRFWGRLAGPRGAAHDRTVEVLERLGLASHADQPFAGCPVGVRRELCLAVALLYRPAVLVLDEPCQGVDDGTRQRIVTTLRRLRDEGMALLYASRDADEVRQVCDRVGVLHEGRLLVEEPLVQAAPV